MLRLLVADDEIIERKVLCKKLRNRFSGELEIEEAENGREVLSLYQKKRADILLLDIEMPGITGLDAAVEIRSQDTECAIIFLTAFDEFDYAKKAIEVHALDYLLKPYDDEELFLVMDAAMNFAERARAGVIQTAPVVSRPVQDGGDADNFAGKILSYIRAHYPEELSVTQTAGEFGYSEAYFCKLFKQDFGESFISYLTSYRIDEAKRRLRETDDSVREIGAAVGYPDNNYFTKVFRRITGQSPTSFRSMVKELPGS